MKLICLGYADEKQWNELSKDQAAAAMEECFSYDDKLRRNGHFVSGEALQGSPAAKTLRWKDGKVTVTDGPYAETREQIGGLIVLEARDMEHAVELMSKHPSARSSPWEIRPIEQAMSDLMKEKAPGVEGAGANARKFLCLGYMEETKWDALSATEQEAFMKECLAHDEALRKQGHWIGGEALQYAREARTLRPRSGKVIVTDGPYAESKEQLGGLVVILARDLDHAVDLMAKSPGIRIGVHLEIRPADESIDALIAARQRRLAADL